MARSLEEDGAALEGWWVQGRVSRLLQIDWGMGSMWAYLLGATREGCNSFDFDLEDSGGTRLIVAVSDHRAELKTPAFEYRLRGDWLELTAVPGADWYQGYPNPKVWELTGTWFRLRFPEMVRSGTTEPSEG